VKCGGEHVLLGVIEYIVDEEIRENGPRNTTPRNADGVTLYASGAREPPPPAVYYDIIIIIIITIHLNTTCPQTNLIMSPRRLELARGDVLGPPNDDDDDDGTRKNKMYKIMTDLRNKARCRAILYYYII